MAAQVVTLRTPPCCRCATAADMRGALPHKKAGRLPVDQALCNGAAEARNDSPRRCCFAGAASKPVRSALLAIAPGLRDDCGAVPDPPSTSAQHPRNARLGTTRYQPETPV